MNIRTAFQLRRKKFLQSFLPAFFLLQFSVCFQRHRRHGQGIPQLLVPHQRLFHWRNPCLDCLRTCRSCGAVCFLIFSGRSRRFASVGLFALRLFGSSLTLFGTNLRNTVARRLTKNSPLDCFCPALQCRSLGATIPNVMNDLYKRSANS